MRPLLAVRHICRDSLFDEGFQTVVTEVDVGGKLVLRLEEREDRQLLFRILAAVPSVGGHVFLKDLDWQGWLVCKYVCLIDGRLHAGGNPARRI